MPGDRAKEGWVPGRTEQGLGGGGRLAGEPRLATMHFAFVLTGLGTAMLGPILPLLSRQWHLADQQSGLLLLAQFCGSFLGGATLTSHLRRGLLLGVAAATVGVAGFAVAPGLVVALPLLVLAGFGFGHAITAVNVLAGQRFTVGRASRLALLNFFWSFGAMLAPLLAGALAPYVSLRAMLLGFAGLFLLCGALLLLEVRQGAALPGSEARAEVAEVGPGLARGTFLFFAAMLFVYGGLETCLSGWLTTYALRYGDARLWVSESATLLLWMSLTAGRALSSAILRRVSERLVWRVALGLSAVLTLGLTVAHSAWSIGAVTVLLGLSLAPWFPVTFSLLMEGRPRARQAGLVIAVSGLGAAALPWLMGVLSTRSGSLQRALVVPFAAAVVLLLMSLRGRGRGEDGGEAVWESGAVPGRRKGV